MNEGDEVVTDDTTSTTNAQASKKIPKALGRGRLLIPLVRIAALLAIALMAVTAVYSIHQVNKSKSTSSSLAHRSLGWEWPWESSSSSSSESNSGSSSESSSSSDDSDSSDSKDGWFDFDWPWVSSSASSSSSSSSDDSDPQNDSDDFDSMSSDETDRPTASSRNLCKPRRRIPWKWRVLSCSKSVSAMTSLETSCVSCDASPGSTVAETWNCLHLFTLYQYILVFLCILTWRKEVWLGTIFYEESLIPYE
jgi:hypothetical protein